MFRVTIRTKEDLPKALWPLLGADAGLRLVRESGGRHGAPAGDLQERGRC
jgi:hypothetical protein